MVRQADAADDKTARELLGAAKMFIGTVLTSMDKQGSRRGRRKAADRNGFWASVAALLPRDLFESKRDRVAMRLLGISYRVVKQAVSLRSYSKQGGGCCKWLSSHRFSGAQRQGGR